MKSKLTSVSILIGCILCVAFSQPAFGNHRSGDFALPEAIAVGDFDQDANLDLLLNVAGFDHVAFFKGDGQGNFTLKRQFETDTLPKGIATGDYDNDGRLDLASIQEWGYNIKVNLGDGLGGFTFIGELNGDGEPTRLTTADLNNDGNLDLIGNAPAEGALLIYFGNGNGGFTTHALELEDLPNDQAIETGDFDGDGDQDIATAYFEDKTSTGSHCVIFLGDGAGNFDRGAEFLINPQATNVVAADMNHDGKLDLVISGAGSENEAGIFVSVFLGDGAGNFALQQNTDLGQGAIRGAMALADFNEDGNTDVAIALSNSGIARHVKSTSVLIFLGDGAGNLTEGETAMVEKEPHTVVARDFSGDGHIDLVVSNRTSATISVLFGDGQAAFTTHATLPVVSLPEGANIAK